MKVSLPLILLNFKTYEKSSGAKGVALAKIAEKVSKKSSVCIAVAPQLPDLAMMAQEVDIPVFSQKIDPIEGGKHTGGVSARSLKNSGIAGTLVNHSECRMLLADLELAVRSARMEHLFTVVCTNNVVVSAAAAHLDPSAIAFEPPELIGTGISVSTAQPNVVENSVKRIQVENSRVIPLIGAGISTGSDVSAALRLGAQGVLLASGVVLADDPEKILVGMTKSILKLKEK